MNNYSDLTAIDQRILITLQLEPVGVPEIEVIVATSGFSGHLCKTGSIQVYTDLIEPFDISIQLKNKNYCDQKETAVIVAGLQIDHIDLIPKFEYLASYENDHDHKDPTNYLGFNGKWTLTIDRPFYQWLHQATAQGWLLS